MKFLERHKLPKLTQEGIGNLNSPISVKTIEFIVKKQPFKSKTPGPDCFRLILPNI